MAHLILHQKSTLRVISEEIEVEANKFASSFLLPRREIRPYLRNLTVLKLASLKRHWRVSMSALLMRAVQLETIGRDEERLLWTEMGRNGWRKREPEQFDVSGEEPGRRYRELVGLYRCELGYTEKDLASTMCISEQDLRDRILPQESGLRLVV